MRTLGVDLYLFGVVRRARSPIVDRAAIVCGHLGRGGLPWIAAAVALGSGRRSLARSEATMFSVAAIGAALVGSTALARLVKRPRPCDRGAASLIPCPEGGAFPSDQAAAAFAAASSLGWLAPPLRAPLFAAAATIAVARVVVGVHYPSDVVGGALLGTSIGRIAHRHAARRENERPAAQGR